MVNVYILCEGQTEEQFVKQVLYPYLLKYGIFSIPVIFATRRTAAKKFRGGVSDYGKIKDQIIRLARSHPNEYVTTMLDYYGLSGTILGKNHDINDLIRRIEEIESNVDQDLGLPNCFFNLMVHEFEAILFSNIDVFRQITDDPTVSRIQAIRTAYPSPEFIDDSPDTAPSKRIKSLIPAYKKVADGIVLAERIGIDRILQECPHFRAWVGKIRALTG